MSISSSEGSPLPQDLPTKYQKLAAEYAKVRSQVTVLKKAVVDEQTRSAELKEVLKTREQTIRKNLQELESLNFRNTQLTKRVTVLQDELDRQGGNSKKGRTKSENSITAEESILFQEELQNRIMENANLLSLLDEKNLEFEKERQEWQEKFSKLDIQTTNPTTSSCQCDALRKKLADLQLVAKEEEKTRVRQQTRSSSVLMQQIQKLSLYPLLSQLFRLFSTRGYVSMEDVSLLSLRDIANFSSQDSFRRALKDHLLVLNGLKSTVPVSDEVVSQLVSLLCDLVTGLVLCLNSNLESAQIEESISTIVEASRSIRTSAQFHSSQLIDDGSQGEMVEILNSIREASNQFWRESIELNVSQRSPTTPSNSSTCTECQSIKRQYQAKIVELEKQRLTTKTSTMNGPIDGMKPTAATISESEQQDIENDFGSGRVLREIGHGDCHGQHILTDCVADRQQAESRVSRLLNELSAFHLKLEQCQEELGGKTGLANKFEEELSITRQNYESQLSSMSEHLANLSDKLVAQQTHIEELTFELSNKNGKRGRK